MKPLRAINNYNYAHLSNRKLFRFARNLFKKNMLFESEEALKCLIHRGYKKTSVRLLQAQCYRRIAFLKQDIDYEDQSKKVYEEILSCSLRKLKRLKIESEYNELINKIKEFNDVEYNALNKARKLHGDSSLMPKSWMIMGNNFNIRKDVDFVIYAYTKALELDPDYMLALFRLGYVYQHNKNDFETAISFYVRLVKLDPAEDKNESAAINAKCILDVCNFLARYFFHKKAYRKVIAVFNRALEIHDAYLPDYSLSCLKDMIYFADRASDKCNLRKTLNLFLSDNYVVSLEELVSSYCTTLMTG